MSNVKQLVIAGLTAVLCSQAVAQEPEKNTISVSGTAVAYVKPDFASVNVGAFAKSPSVIKAKKECDAHMAKALAAVRKLGVKPDDIATNYYSITPVRSKAGATISWKVVESATIKVRKIDLVAEVVDAAVSNGAPNITNIWFGLEAVGPARDKVRAQAVKAATDKAAELAKLAGVELGDVVSIVEGGDYGYMAQRMANYADSGVAGFYVGESISPGRESVSLTVQMVFAIKGR